MPWILSISDFPNSGKDLAEANGLFQLAAHVRTAPLGRQRFNRAARGELEMSFARFTPETSLVMLVDHQTMTIDWVKSLPKSTTIASCRVLTRMATSYDMPLVLTTTMEEYVGPTIEQISELAPAAFEARFKRGGELSCWDDPRLDDHVRSLGRPDIVLAGLTTDICLFWAAVDGLKRGYRIMVVADACGTMSTLGDQLTYDRLRQMGVAVTVVNQAVTELVNNFGTPDGQKAQQIMAEEIISKLGQSPS